MINVLALDPGLARFGAGIIQTDGIHHEAVRIDTFESELRAGDFDIYLAEDRVRRTRDLARWLRMFCHGFDIQIVAAEAMSFPRGTNAITCMCLAWGVVASFLEDRAIPMVSAMPSHWRTHLVGPPPSRKMPVAARKKLVEGREAAAHAKAVQLVPSAVPLIRRLQPNERQVHALDQLGVFCWSLSTVNVRRALNGAR